MTDKQTRAKEDIINTQELALKLDVTDKTIRNWIKAGKIGHFDKIGNQWRFSWSCHVLPFLEHNEFIPTWQKIKEHTA